MEEGIKTDGSRLCFFKVVLEMMSIHQLPLHTNCECCHVSIWSDFQGMEEQSTALPLMPQCLGASTSRTHFFKYPKKNLYDCDLEAQSISF